MTVYGTLIGDTFDIHDIDETNASLTRNKTTVRFTYKDEEKKLISLSVGNHQKCRSRKCTAHSYREQWSFAVLEAN